MKYEPKKIEACWQKEWEKKNFYRAKDFDKKPKQFIMVEFPYPSGEGLHVGHVRSYVALDALARKKRMEGYNVLFPIGWDAFGLPTENYAIKTGIHPRKATDQNIKNFKRQIKSLGISFDWSREINTTDPKYYKWTQWIFLKFFENGLAYRLKMPINWCPSCKIGLANEEVIEGKCERCGKETEKKEIEQWMLKITAYAEKLLSGLKNVDYSERIESQQENWIGKSEGIEIKFLIPNYQFSISVFTTRADTIFGVTAIVLAPEHPLVEKITTKEYKKEVEDYVKQTKKKSEFERISQEKEKTGVFTGSFCLNPLSNEKAPIWVGDYVISSYGGGAVMVVPAHDERDFQFAVRYNIPIRKVIAPRNNAEPFDKTQGRLHAEPRGKLNEVFVDYGILIDSGEFSGLKSEEAIKKIADWLKEKKLGGPKIQYKLRDWVFSRQHYWGEPIPIIYCRKCWKKNQKSPPKAGLPRVEKIKNNEQLKFNYDYTVIDGLEYSIVPVPYKDLPVKLPYVEKYQPTETGRSPLENIKNWVNAKCPRCGGKARRETDTMPNWAGSSWYFLRYADPKINKHFADLKKLKYWLPVDLYNGGMEHTTLHLLYSRFWHRFLYDLKFVPTQEPYAKRRSHGVVLAEDGRKMSKSFGNVINPDEVADHFGADCLRLYEMFMGPFEQMISWNTKGLEGCRRFLEKVFRLFISESEDSERGLTRIAMRKNAGKVGAKSTEDLEVNLHKLIKKTEEDLEVMKFNTAIAFFMEFVNFWMKDGNILSKKDTESFLKILAPFAPHITEELWRKLGNKKSIHLENWPKYNSRLIKEKAITLIIQINGKVRDKIEAPADISEKEAKELALARERVKQWIGGKEIKRIIFVKGKLVNIVI